MHPPINNYEFQNQSGFQLFSSCFIWGHRGSTHSYTNITKALNKVQYRPKYSPMLRSCRADTFPGHRKREKAESNPGGVEGNDELKRKKNREVLRKEKEDEKKVEKGKI